MNMALEQFKPQDTGQCNQTRETNVGKNYGKIGNIICKLKYIYWVGLKENNCI